MKSRATLLGAALAVAMAGASGLAVAQQATAPGAAVKGEQAHRGHGQPRPSPEVIQRMIDGRLAGVKAALRLTPDQEKLWPAVENAIRANANERMQLRQQMRQAREQGAARPDMIQRLEQASSRLEARAAAVKRLAEAVKPLYATLSDDQKQVLRLTARQAFAARQSWRHHTRENRG
jgi:hypothetical protein